MEWLAHTTQVRRERFPSGLALRIEQGCNRPKHDIGNTIGQVHREKISPKSVCTRRPGSAPASDPWCREIRRPPPGGGAAARRLSFLSGIHIPPDLFNAGPDTLRLQFQKAPPGPGLHGSREKHRQPGVRQYNGADVAPVHDDVKLPRQGALHFQRNARTAGMADTSEA